MVVFVTTEFTVCVTDKTPEISTRPLNDASPDVNFGAVTIPVNVGDALFAFIVSTEENELSTVPLYVEKEASTLVMLAFKLSALCVALEIGLFASDVSSALPKPTILFVMPLTVPVKVGDAMFAFKFNDASTALMLAFKLRAVCAEVEIGLFASDVSSALPKPTILFEMPPTVPVKVGLLMGAFKFKEESV